MWEGLGGVGVVGRLEEMGVGSEAGLGGLGEVRWGVLARC